MIKIFERLFNKYSPISPKDYLANKIRTELDNKIREYLHDPSLQNPMTLSYAIYGVIVITMKYHRENTKMRVLCGLSRAEYDKFMDALTTEIMNKYLKH